VGGVGKARAEASQRYEPLAILVLNHVFKMGGAADIPVVGDFDGDGIDDPGLYREAITPPTDRQARSD
jgi:hypothetical protein